MITSTAISKSPVSVKSFPGLYINDAGDVIIFCDDINKTSSHTLSGIVVMKSSIYRLGHYSNQWLSSHFKPYYGSVTLTQDDK